MRAAATPVGFSAVLPAKARPAARSTVVARVPATRRSVNEAAATAVMAEPAEVVARVPATRRIVDEAAATAVVAEPAEVDYSSRFSVFPMEACDLLGGDACMGMGPMYPEAKLAAAAAPAPEASRRVDGVERDYLSYDGPKTVFPGEACDLLGGEFCEAPYLDGVYRELPHA